MKLASKLVAALSAVFLLAACETAPGDSAGGSGTGGVGGNAGGGEMSYLPGTDIPDRVFFDFDSSSIRADAQSTLERQAGWLNKNGSSKIVVEGHCDERGTREYNLALGERRANATKNYLVSLGVARNRIKTTSYGKERPAVIGSDEAAWAQNRRAVTVVGQ